MEDYSLKEDFKSISKIHGQIEITFNKKIEEFDQYETVENQLDELILGIGKTGRSNRLTIGVDEVDSEKLRDIADTFEELAEVVEQIEEFMNSARDGNE